MKLIGARTIGWMRRDRRFGRAGFGKNLGGPLHYSLPETGGWLLIFPGRSTNAKRRRLAPPEARVQQQSGIAQEARRSIQSPQWDDPVAAVLPAGTFAKFLNSLGLLWVPAIMKILRLSYGLG
jgi:hypothetical protein